MTFGRELKIAAIVAAATIGDGVFALPYVFKGAGWLVGLFYLVVLAEIVAGTQVIYWRTLEKNGERKRLLGLARQYLGVPGFWAGFFSIVVGLLLVLVAYLVLGSAFMRLADPALTPAAALALFWAAVAIPVFLRDRRAVELEIVGVACAAAVVIFIFVSAFPNLAFAGVPAVLPGRLFLPFGAILFALAGWTGIEPAFELRRKGGGGSSWGVALGTVFAAALILMFVMGVLGSTPQVTPDTVSGLLAWPVWKRGIVAFLGFLAVWTTFMPISHEIKNALVKDLRVHSAAARFIIVLVPLFLVLLGLNNFFVIVAFVGGVFLSVQYLLIIAVGRRALVPPPGRRLLLDVISAVFVLGFVYELWTFIVH